MELFEEIDAILIKNSSIPFIDENFFYFTGIEGMEESIAIITPDGIEIIAPLLEKRDGIIVYKSRKERDEILKKMLHGKKVGINGKAMVYEDYIHFKKMFDLVDVGKRLQMKRAIKSREEIKKIKKAVSITKEILKKIELEGRSERDVANEIKCMLAKKNAEEAFKTIVAFGKNSSMPH
ncbi:MAG: M24 family metallopeptidase, partial [Thermoplasmata archaeon]